MSFLDIEEAMMSNLTLRKLQSVSGRWAARNFGDKRPTYHPLLGVSEEVGELCHAHLKREQGIRGTEAELIAQAKDAVGDIVIFLADYCNLNGIDLQEAVEMSWREVSKRDWVVNKVNGTVKDILLDDGMNNCTGDCGSCSCDKKIDDSKFGLTEAELLDRAFGEILDDDSDNIGRGQE